MCKIVLNEAITCLRLLRYELNISIYTWSACLYRGFVALRVLETLRDVAEALRR